LIKFCLPNDVIEWSALLLPTRWAAIANLGQEEDCTGCLRCFPKYLQANVEI